MPSKLSPKKKVKKEDDIQCHTNKTKDDCDKNSRCKWDDVESQYGYQKKCRSRLFEDLKIPYPPTNIEHWNIINQSYDELLNKKNNLNDIERDDLNVLQSMKDEFKDVNEKLSKQSEKDTIALTNLYVKQENATNQSDKNKIEERINKKKKSIREKFESILNNPLTLQLLWFVLYSISALTASQWMERMFQKYLETIDAQAKLEAEKTKHADARTRVGINKILILILFSVLDRVSGAMYLIDSLFSWT